MQSTNAANRFLSKIKGPEAEAEKDSPREPNAPWFSFRTSYPSRRAIKRQRLRDMRGTTRKYHKGVALQERDFNRIAEREAVRRLRIWEAEHGRSALEFAHLGRLVTAGGVDAVSLAGVLGLLDDDEAAE